MHQVHHGLNCSESERPIQNTFHYAIVCIVREVKEKKQYQLQEDDPCCMQGTRLRDSGPISFY